MKLALRDKAETEQTEMKLFLATAGFGFVALYELLPAWVLFLVWLPLVAFGLFSVKAGK